MDPVALILCCLFLEYVYNAEHSFISRLHAQLIMKQFANMPSVHACQARYQHNTPPYHIIHAPASIHLSYSGSNVSVFVGGNPGDSDEYISTSTGF